MKMSKKLVIASLIVPLSFGAVSAFAYGGKDGKGPRHEDGFNMTFDRHLLRKLDLTDEQIAQLKTLRKSTKEEMKAKRKGDRDVFREARIEQQQKITALMLADTFDENAAKQLIKQMDDKRLDRRVEMLKKQHEVLALLTPEQKTKLTELIQERMSKMDARRGKGEKQES